MYEGDSFFTLTVGGRIGLLILSACLALALFAIPLSAEGTRLLRHPDVSDRHIVFAYANDRQAAHDTFL